MAMALDVLDAKPPLAEASRHWLLESSEVFLNHGSHGACPLPVLAKQRSLQGRLERNPIAFFSRDGEGLLDGARRKLAAFLGADPSDLVFVPNATTGVNAVLQSLLRPSDGWPGWQRGDEILTTDHGYRACRNALDALAAWTGVNIVVAPVPVPLASPGQVIDALAAHTTAQTRLLLIDAVTSPTALVLPVAEIVAQWQRSRGIDVLIDGAHGPGMVPLNLEMLGAAYYVGNGHKWLCAPKGSGFLYVRGDRHGRVRPLVISHGATDPRRDRGERSQLWLEFDWTGTDDPTPWLCMPEAIAFMGQLLEGGWDDLMQHNRTLATEARRWIEDRWGIDQSVGPESTTGAMASILLPDLASRGWSARSLQAVLFDRYQIEVPVIEWPLATAAHPVNFLRISAQLYNHMPQYQYLGEAVAQLLDL